MRLTDRGHAISEEAGGMLVFYTPDSPRNPLPEVLIKPSRERASGIRPGSKRKPRSEPLEGKFRIVDGSESVRSTTDKAVGQRGLPVPYAATAGVVVHKTAQEIQVKRRRNPPADRRAFRPPSPMMHQIAMLAEVDPDATETNNMLLRRELAAALNATASTREQERVKTLVAPPPTWADLAAGFGTSMMQARTKGSKRSSNPKDRLADMPNRADEDAEEVYEPREVRRVVVYKHDKPQPPHVSAGRIAAHPRVETGESDVEKALPWKRSPKPTASKRTWLERLFAPGQSRKPVWK